MIIATAGHIDHGKTALVRALTGVDTDRFKEERARGISIDVGFAHRLTAGNPPLSFVDVPGHERFVKNMLAGVAAIDCALLVVAADDGPMPQTREHLEIVDLLGIDALFVALTKIDRADVDRIEEAAREIDDLLAATRFRSTPVFHVSARSGVGLDLLLDALSDHAAVARSRSSDGLFRMAIDRAFSLPGVGPVVTGSVASGTVTVGETLMVSPLGMTVRVRSLCVHGIEAQHAAAGMRCAAGLAGADLHHGELARGTWLVAPPLHRPTHAVALRMLICRGAPVLRGGLFVHLHVFGTLPAGSDYFASTIDMMRKLKPVPHSIALLYADDAFDVTCAKGTRPLLESAGFEIALDERFSTNASDFSSLLSQIKSKDIDAVLFCGHETESLNFTRQTKSLGVNPKLYSFTVGVPSEDYRRALGADANYAFGMSAWLPSPALKDRWFGDAQAFAKAYEAKFGYEPDYHAASGVADVEAYAKAIEAAGSLDRQKVRDALAKINFDSLYGRIRFNPKGQIEMKQIVVQVQKGEVVAVYGDKGFIAQPQYPMPAWNKR